jgi:hypothetical protein
MKITLFSLFLLIFLPAAAHAGVPEPVVPATVADVPVIEDPEMERSYFGLMNSFPHTYELVSGKPFRLFAEIKIPDVPEALDNISAIIIKKTDTGRVEEVGRLYAKDASWERKKDWSSNDWYRIGPIFDEELQAGAYRFEVNTPDNIEKYVLTIGFREEREGAGYFETLAHLAQLKEFFGKSQFRIIESPRVLIPVLIIIACAAFLLQQGRRRRDTGML